MRVADFVAADSAVALQIHPLSAAGRATARGAALPSAMLPQPAGPSWHPDQAVQPAQERCSCTASDGTIADGPSVRPGLATGDIDDASCTMLRSATPAHWAISIQLLCLERSNAGAAVCCERAVPVRDGTELYRRWGTAPRSRPAGAGFKPPQAARVKSPGGERCWKRRKLFRQVGLEETNASEPLMTCRKAFNRRRNRDRVAIPRARVGRCLLTAQPASGMKAA